MKYLFRAFSCESLKLVRSMALSTYVCFFTLFVTSSKVLAISCLWALFRLVKILTRVTESASVWSWLMNQYRHLPMSTGSGTAFHALMSLKHLFSPALSGGPRHLCQGGNWRRVALFRGYPTTCPKKGESQDRETEEKVTYQTWHERVNRRSVPRRTINPHTTEGQFSLCLTLKKWHYL